jgi:hypothetical protein
MKQLYNEGQYQVYSKLLEEMANADSVVEQLRIHASINIYFFQKDISEAAKKQMDDRMEKEFAEGDY